MRCRKRDSGRSCEAVLSRCCPENDARTCHEADDVTVAADAELVRLVALGEGRIPARGAQ
jgi:hypothetical protein